MDVVTAFLYGSIIEEVYVQQPIGFFHGDSACRLNKALYGLKQSPRIWYYTLMQALKEVGFFVLEYDYSLFINTFRRTFIVVYVDDLFLIGPDIEFINSIKDHLALKFQITDMGPVSIYFNINISRDLYVKTLIISQNKYV